MGTFFYEDNLGIPTRFVELHRAFKFTASLYLHCDLTILHSEIVLDGLLTKRSSDS